MLEPSPVDHSFVECVSEVGRGDKPYERRSGPASAVRVMLAADVRMHELTVTTTPRPSPIPNIRSAHDTARADCSNAAGGHRRGVFDVRFSLTHAQMCAAVSIAEALNLDDVPTVPSPGVAADHRDAVCELRELLRRCGSDDDATRGLSEVCQRLGGLPRAFIRDDRLNTTHIPAWVRLAACTSGHRRTCVELGHIVGLVGANITFETLWDIWPGSAREYTADRIGLRIQLEAATDLYRICEHIDTEGPGIRVLATLLCDGIAAERIGELSDVVGALVSM